MLEVNLPKQSDRVERSSTHTVSLELMNYTTDTATEYQQFEGDTLQSYIDEHQGDEVGVSHCSIIAINSLDEAISFLDMSDEEHEQLEVVSDHCGYSYFTKLDEALAEFENINYIRIEGADSLHQIAHKLNFELYLADELCTLLGCSAEAMEQLGSYISDDDIVHTIETEYSYTITNNSAYIII